MSNVLNTPHSFNASLRPQLQHELKHMTHKDMQKAAILRGMKPRHVVKSDYFQLLGYINEHYSDPLVEEKLLKFDRWTERKAGPVDKSLRMSYVSQESVSEEAMEEVEIKKIEKKKVKEKAPVKKRVKNEDGIVTGTKKSYVFEMVKAGKDTERIIKRTIKRFPDAKENSIKIWISKAKKLFKTTG